MEVRIPSSYTNCELDLCSCVRPITHHPQATILLLQLQALYNVLLLVLTVAVKLRPGVCIQQFNTGTSLNLSLI